MVDSTKRTAETPSFSRRSLLRGVGVLGLGLGVTTLAAACGTAQPNGGGSGAGSGGSGGTLTIGIDGTSAIHDPAFYTTLGDWMVVDCVCRGLTFIDFETNEPQPDLAESWTVSEDGRTYTFTLRQGVTFHDGSTLTANDVVRSLSRQFDKNDPTLPTGSSRPLKSIGNNLESIRAVDDSTVELVLQAPDGTVLSKLSDIGGRIMPAAAIEQYGQDIGKNLIGTGPYKLVSSTSGQNVVLEAFDDYYEGAPATRRLVLQQIQDPSTIISSLISGDISATELTPHSSLGQLRGNDKVVVYEPDPSFDAFVIMDVRQPALAELEVRKAINLAIDRKAILEQVFFGVGALPEGYLLPPSVEGYDTSLAGISKSDPAEARRLLESVGASGRRLTLLAASDAWHPRAAQIVEQNLKDIGLEVTVETIDPATFSSRVFDPTSSGHELMIWERNSYVPDPDNLAGEMTISTGVYAGVVGGYNTLPGYAETFDPMVKQARALTNSAERKEIYTALQKKFADEIMGIAMLACASNPVVTGAGVSDLNLAALANHRCFAETARV